MGAILKLPEPPRARARKAVSVYAMGEQALEVLANPDLTNLVPIGWTGGDGPMPEPTPRLNRSPELGLIFCILRALPATVRTKAIMDAYKRSEQEPHSVEWQQAAFAAAALSLTLEKRT